MSKQVVVLLLLISSSLFHPASVKAASFEKYAPKLLRFEGIGFGIHKGVWGDRDYSKEEALTILKKNYWNRYHGDAFASQQMAEVLIDHLINAGHGKGEHIKAFEAIIGAKQDGVLSLADVQLANNFYAAEQVVNPYVKYRLLYYASRRGAANYPGWITRAKSFLIKKSEGMLIKDINLPDSVERAFKNVRLNY